MSQPFSSIDEDNLHRPEPEQPDSGPALKKRALQKMLIPSIKHAVHAITVTSLLSTTRSLNEWKITLWNFPCSLNLWWKWMKTLVHSGSKSHYQTRNWSLDNLLCQDYMCCRHQWNSFVFLVLSNLNWRWWIQPCYAFLHHRYLIPTSRREASIVCIQGCPTLCGITQ